MPLRQRGSGFRAASVFIRPYPTRLLADWTLGFKQSSLHPAIRASTGERLDGFTAPRLLGHAAFPFGFPRQVGPTAQGPRELVGSHALSPSRVTRGSTAPCRVPPHTF